MLRVPRPCDNWGTRAWRVCSHVGIACFRSSAPGARQQGEGLAEKRVLWGMRRALTVPLMGPIPLALPPSPHPVLTPALCGPPLPQHRALLLGSPSPCRTSFSGLLQARPPCHPTILSNGAFHGLFPPFLWARRPCRVGSGNPTHHPRPSGCLLPRHLLCS